MSIDELIYASENKILQYKPYFPEPDLAVFSLCSPFPVKKFNRDFISCLYHDLKITTEYLQPDIEKFREIVVPSRSLCILYR